ncbi:MAG TPA: cytochrome c biogenesis protein CcdA [Dehalococcoidia bacterium]|nr:cytochrome c biogenesis protein CcdA [Dehalococcoidia bacterium]
MSLEIAGISIIAAFFAGVLSVASPCMLPIVPAYLGYLTGAAFAGEGAPSSQRSYSAAAVSVAAGGGGTVAVAERPDQRAAAGSAGQSPFLHALSFVSGFSLVFIIFGVSLGLVGFFLRDQQDLILKVSGSLLILLGLHLAQVITIPFMEREKRWEVASSAKAGYARSFVVGSAFSCGWSPCIGPTLGAILALAVSSGTVAQASLLLTAYSVGLAIPFLAMGLAFNSVRPVYERLKRYMGVINYISGALLIIMGILIFTNSLINLNSLFNFGFLQDITSNA